MVRTFRMAHIVKYFRELRGLILSLWYSIKSFLWLLVFIGLLMYLYSVISLQGMSEYTNGMSDFSFCFGAIMYVHRSCASTASTTNASAAIPS